MRAILLAFCLLAASQASATSTLDLYEKCRAATTPVDQATRKIYVEAMQCFAFIDGALGTAALFGDLHGVKIYCPPSGVTNIQVAKILVRFVDENPNFMHRQASAIFAAAMRSAFPCDEQRSR